ncbi:uncharacterized protein WCC33_015965 [Rhinophrynus dorsalis]
MPSCLVKGCKHRTGQKGKHPTVVLHVFPSSLYYIKQWLIQTKQDFGDLDAFAQTVLDGKKSDRHRLCSRHFTSSCYTAHGSKLVLKKDAIPTIFPGDYEITPKEDISTGPPCKKFRADLSAVRHPPSTITTGTPSTPICVDASTQTSPHMGVKTLGTSTNPKYQKRNVSMQTYIPYVAHVGVQCGEMTEFDMLIKSESDPGSTVINDCGYSTNFSTPSQQLNTTHNTIRVKEENLDHLEEYYKPRQVPSKTTADFPRIASTVGKTVVIIKEEEYTPESYTFVETDTNFEHDSSDENLYERTLVPRMYYERVSIDNVEERRYLVLESSLDKLFYRIQCGAGLDCTSLVAHIEKNIAGSCMSVTGYCLNGHEFQIWDRQPIS